MAKLCEPGNYRIDIFSKENSMLLDFQKNVNKICESAKQWQSSLEVSDIRTCTNLSDKDVKYLVDKNKQLKAQIEDLTIHVKAEKEKYYQFRADKKLLTEEIKYMFDALLRAKKYYKTSLNTYFNILANSETQQTIYVQFFTENKLNHDNFSVLITRYKNTDEFEVTKMNPMLTTFKEIQQKLTDSKDLPGIICCIRQSFLNIKEKRIL